MEEHSTTALRGREELGEDQALDGEPTDPSTGQATEPAEVRALDYTQLRLLAELAVGTKDGEHVNFFFAEPGDPGVPIKLERHARGQPLTSRDIVAPASNPHTRFPRNQVTVSASGGASATEGDPLMGVPDAMFWSDAAVQKFVVPYLASCAGTGLQRPQPRHPNEHEGVDPRKREDVDGPHPTDVLQLLQDAWNFYPSRDVSVYALAHVADFEPGVELSLKKAFQVGFTRTTDGGENPPLHWMPLDDFTEKYPPSSGSGDLPKPPVKYHRGKRHVPPQYPNYLTLRAMAEYAASLRGDARYFLLPAAQPDKFTGPFKHLPAVKYGDIVIPVQTATVPYERKDPGAVWFQPPEGVAPINLAAVDPKVGLPRHDAVFWSTGAIEQFLFPYYASKCGFAALAQLAKMYAVWTGKLPAGWPNPTQEASFAAETGAEDSAFGDEEVFALVHLYTSEWVEETEETMGEEETAETAEAMAVKGALELGREIGVVSRDPGNSANLRVRTLHRLPGWRGAPPA
jgi:hypothetical protein